MLADKSLKIVSNQPRLGSKQGLDSSGMMFTLRKLKQTKLNGKVSSKMNLHKSFFFFARLAEIDVLIMMS